MRLFDRAQGEVRIDFPALFALMAGDQWHLCIRWAPRGGALVGKYASSEERLQDTAGIKPPKIGGLKNFPFRELQDCRSPLGIEDCENSCESFGTFVGI
jgi:hypothetical protein